MFEKKEHQNSGTLGKDTINNWIILMKNRTKIGLKLNKQMVGLTDIEV